MHTTGVSARLASKMASRRELKSLGREVAGYFTADSRYKFIGFAGMGRHGGALILSVRDTPGKAKRRIVIKYSFGALTLDRHSNADEDLRNEYKWLRRLQGCEHIVQLIPMADCSINIPGTSNGDQTARKPPSGWRRIRRFLSFGWRRAAEHPDDGQEGVVPAENRRCPTFAIEWLPLLVTSQVMIVSLFSLANLSFISIQHSPSRQESYLLIRLMSRGTTKQFMERLIHNDYHVIPNRVLWKVWLCSKDNFFESLLRRFKSNI